MLEMLYFNLYLYSAYSAHYVSVYIYIYIYIYIALAISDRHVKKWIYIYVNWLQNAVRKLLEYAYRKTNHPAHCASSVKPGSHERHKHNQRKQSMTSPLGLAKTK